MATTVVRIPLGDVIGKEVNHILHVANHLPGCHQTHIAQSRRALHGRILLILVEPMTGSQAVTFLAARISSVHEVSSSHPALRLRSHFLLQLDVNYL